MLIYVNTVYDYITAWVRTLVESSKKKGLLCVITGGSDSCLNAALSLRSTSYIPVYLIFMGFKPENESVFEKWVISNFSPEKYKIIKPTHPTLNDPALQNIDIRSSMISTYVDMYSKLYDCINMGAITRSEYSLVKFFKSRIDEIFDYYPLIDLYKSECIQLSNFISLPPNIVSSTSTMEMSFGFTYEELEWLDRENENLSIVSASNFPNMAPHWGLFDTRKKLLLTRVYQMQKDNKNKTIPDQKKCLVRKAMPGSIT